jgi:hypothetical protein
MHDGVLRLVKAELTLLFLYIITELQVPCAHAPGLPPLDVDASISPKYGSQRGVDAAIAGWKGRSRLISSITGPAGRRSATPSSPASSPTSTAPRSSSPAACTPPPATAAPRSGPRT